MKKLKRLIKNLIWLFNNNLDEKMNKPTLSYSDFNEFQRMIKHR